jgi:WhiB family redox-sensing transcriptional regulator
MEAQTMAEVIQLGIPGIGGYQPGGWRDRALCAETDPEAWFPEKGGSTREAKTICNGLPARPVSGNRPAVPARLPCPVRAECLQYALEHDERFGIWGGLSERERRQRKREAA